MKYRVKISKEPKYNVRVKMPQAKTGMQVEGSLYNEPATFGGADNRNMVPDTDVRKTITKVPREEANLEAEGGETVLTFDAAGYPLFYEIKGPRHSNNGVPLNLPDDSFIFSDTRSMRINDQEILDMFGLSKKKGGYTPADISKKYLELNKYREILQSPDSDKIAQATAERMIKSMIIKLGALAIAQESKKGFPQGVPAVARPYMDAYGISEEQLVPQQQEQGQEEMMMSQPSPMESGVEQIPPTQAEQQDMMQMPPEMMQQAPMAAYGAIMGGYNMPMYPNGGTPIRPYEQANTRAGNITPTAQSNRWSARQQPLDEFLGGWEQHVPGISQMTEGEAQKAMYEWALQNNPDVIRDMWKEYGLTAKGRGIPALEGLTNQGVFDDATLADIENLRALQEGFVDNKFGVRQLSYNPPPPPKKGCPCEDGTYSEECCPDTQKKGCPCEDGTYSEECCPDTKKQCKCTDPNTGEVTYMEPDENGKCPCQGSKTIEEPGIDTIQQRGTVFPEDVAALYATLGYRLPRKDPMAVGPRGTQFEQYGVDWRAQANANTATAAATQRALSRTAGANPAGLLAGSYQSQKAANEANRAAINQANQINTQTRNQEMLGNTQLRQQFLDKDAAYKLDYDAKLAQQAQNQARNYNAKLAETTNKAQQLAQHAGDLALVNADNKWEAYDPVRKEIYQKRPWQLGYDPNLSKNNATDMASQVTRIMQSNPDITDATALKILNQYGYGKFGGPTMFEDGGYIYTVFPTLTL